MPGVRENGAQYTHAAAWVIKAMALLGDGDRAWELFHLVNPINHSRTPLECAVYRWNLMWRRRMCIPPILRWAGRLDLVYGAAGWLYRVALENILGLKKRGTPSFSILHTEKLEQLSNELCLQTNPYRIIVRNPRE